MAKNVKILKCSMLENFWIGLECKNYGMVKNVRIFYGPECNKSGMVKNVNILK